ncbi:putative ankyrin repeat protein RF_0381 [Cotesia glomerata]|uniref:putative ankyrin repeat protein RF_0381 n=1 Tax=Cotesia glomerata TaxID=32391 RepID=UPI001D02539A|nr:putative ankyrin repeat protein RF_0381 [Cotesia glomerata]
MTSNARNSYVTLLHKAVDDNNYKEAKNLINLGENVNAMCYYHLKKYKININCTALHLAVCRRNKKIMELLLKNNADVNIEAHCPDTDDHNCSIMRNYLSRTPLLLAIAKENKEMVELLIKYNVDVNLKTSTGESALGLALKGNEEELIEILLTAGADIDLRSQNLFSVVARGEDETIVKILIQHNAEVNLPITTQKTPLGIAIYKKNIGLMELLIHADAHVKSINSGNVSPLYLAMCTGNVQVMEFLLDHGADFGNIVKFRGYSLCLENFGNIGRNVTERHTVKLKALSLFPGPYSGHKLAMKLTHVSEDNLALLKKKAKLTFPLYGELIKHHLIKAA